MSNYGALANFRMTDKDRYELKLAGLLHDCGKITTPVHIIDKATKLSTIFDRIALVDMRFEVLSRDLKMSAMNEILQIPTAQKKDIENIETRLAEALKKLEGDRQFLRGANKGSEHMNPDDHVRIQRIAAYTYVDSAGLSQPLLTDDEVKNLNIERGTLTPEERTVINHHIVATIEMLEALPWPKHLEKVPEYAGGHHERMDGKGYPRGLTGNQMSVQARAMAISDIFEALTAKDRPYKSAKTLTEALEILGQFRLNGHIDPDLFDVFVREKLYLKFAQAYLDEAQIDFPDHAAIPGFAS